MVCADGNLVFQFTVFIIQIKMRPAIALTPFNQFFSVIYQAQPSCFNIGIQTFLYQRFYICR